MNITPREATAASLFLFSNLFYQTNRFSLPAPLYHSSCDKTFYYKSKRTMEFQLSTFKKADSPLTER